MTYWFSCSCCSFQLYKREANNMRARNRFASSSHAGICFSAPKAKPMHKLWARWNFWLQLCITKHNGFYAKLPQFRRRCHFSWLSRTVYAPSNARSSYIYCILARVLTYDLLQMRKMYLFYDMMCKPKHLRESSKCTDTPSRESLSLFYAHIFSVRHNRLWSVECRHRCRGLAQYENAVQYELVIKCQNSQRELNRLANTHHS